MFFSLIMLYWMESPKNKVRLKPFFECYYSKLGKKSFIWHLLQLLQTDQPETLTPLLGEVNNTDHRFMIQCFADTPWVPSRHCCRPSTTPPWLQHCPSAGQCTLSKEESEQSWSFDLFEGSVTWFDFASLCIRWKKQKLIHPFSLNKNMFHFET